MPYVVTPVERQAEKGAGEKGVGSIPAIRCNAGKLNKEVGCEVRCIGEAVLMNLG